MPAFFSSMDLNTPTKRPAIQLETIDRTSVRALVAEDKEYLLRAIAAGENAHHVSLDRQDQIDAFAASLNEDDKAEFYRLYLEELNASTQASLDATAAMNAQTAEIHIQNAQAASNVATWISLIGFFGFLFFMIKMFKG